MVYRVAWEVTRAALLFAMGLRELLAPQYLLSP